MCRRLRHSSASAPPTVPGTPMSPSIPPRLCFAQNVTVRPRSAAASTLAMFPSMTTSGIGFGQLQDDEGQFAIDDQQIRAAAQEFVRDAVAGPARFSNSGIAS